MQAKNKGFLLLLYRLAPKTVTQIKGRLAHLKNLNKKKKIPHEPDPCMLVNSIHSQVEQIGKSMRKGKLLTHMM